MELSFGGRHISRQVQPQGNNIDFLNYLSDGNGSETSGLLSFGFSLAPNATWEFLAGFSMMSDLRPSYMNVKAVYHAGSIGKTTHWGLSAGVSVYPAYLNGYNAFHLQHDTGLIADLNNNFRQKMLYDPGCTMAAFIEHNHKNIRMHIGSGFRVSSFIPFSDVITQKKAESNFRREIRYETMKKLSVSSHSEARILFGMLRKPGFTMDLQIKAEVIAGFRTIPYSRTIMTWTADNVVSADIEPSSRLYVLSESGAGIVIGF